MSQKIELGNNISRNEGGLLASLWRKILTDNRINSNILEYLVGRYVTKTDMMQGRVLNVKRKTKSSLIKNITDGEMTWKTFLDLLFNFMNVKKMVITIKLTAANGDETIHTVNVDNVEFSDTEDQQSQQNDAVHKQTNDNSMKDKK